MLTGRSEDDIMLEIIIFIGTCVSDDKCAPIFASSQLVQVRHASAKSAYVTYTSVSIRQHTSACTGKCAPIFASSQLVQVRQYDDTYSRRQHTAAYVSGYVSIRQHTSADVVDVSIRQHTSAYVSICYIRVLILAYIQVLYELMADKQEDDEMVLQTCADVF